MVNSVDNVHKLKPVVHVIIIKLLKKNVILLFNYKQPQGKKLI